MNPANPTRVARYLASAAVKVFTGFDATADLRKALGLMVAPETVEEMPEDKALEGMGRRVVRALAPADQRPVCLFVTYSPDGRIWPHVISYCKDLKAGGCRLVMIVTTDRTDLKCYDPGLAVADSLIVLENFGYDFSAGRACSGCGRNSGRRPPCGSPTTASTIPRACSPPCWSA